MNYHQEIGQKVGLLSHFLILQAFFEDQKLLFLETDK